MEFLVLSSLMTVSIASEFVLPVLMFSMRLAVKRPHVEFRGVVHDVTIQRAYLVHRLAIQPELPINKQSKLKGASLFVYIDRWSSLFAWID
jgi:hypothetical protein